MEESRLIHNFAAKPTSQIPAEAFSLEPNNSDVKEVETLKPSDLPLGSCDEGGGGGGGGGRDRLKRHREEVAGEVVIPDKWGKEQLLKDWIEYGRFDAFFAPHRLVVTARDALIADARQAKSQRFRVHSGF